MAYFVKSTRSIGLTQSVLHFNFKSGYSNELKAKVVSEYLKGGIGYRELSVRYGIPSRANIRTWVNQARTHGIESLKVKHNKATYSQTFKITVVEYVHTHVNAGGKM